MNRFDRRVSLAILAVWLLIQSQHVASRIAEPRRDFGRIRPDRLHDLAPVSENCVNCSGDAVNHNVEQ